MCLERVPYPLLLFQFFLRTIVMQSENTQLISEQLERFVVWTKVEDSPEEHVIKAQRHILDSVGAGIAGAVSPETKLLNKVFAIGGGMSGQRPCLGPGI